MSQMDQIGPVNAPAAAATTMDPEMTETAPTVHAAALAYAQEVAHGTLSRRAFLTRATALGVSATGAYGLIGATPAHAQTEVRRGGTLRLQMDVRAMKDPLTFDWPQMANIARGWLEYLVQYNPDGSFEGRLLESWAANADATEYLLNLHPGVTWNDGTPFTAADVIHNFTRWCDASIEGNSMATRLSALQDEAGTMLRDGAVEALDDLTVRLTLSRSDITIIPTLANYPAAVVQAGFSGSPAENQIGTGPYLLTEFEVGVRAVLERNPDHDWWDAANGAWLDRIEILDLGTDQAAYVASVESGEVDMLYETLNEFIDIFGAIGMTRSETISAATIVLRTNQTTPPYDDVRVRRALALACDNQALLDLGLSGRGVLGENHHVCPIHPEYADIGPATYDPEAARALMEEAGYLDYEHELISIDDSWRRPTTDALAAQLRDAGFNVTRTIYPGATFWNNWLSYPFSSTDWAHRPLGIQNLTLAYGSGAVWNETGFANAEFDSLLDQASAIADADERRVLMARLQEIMIEEGVVIQPYWRSIFRHHAANVVGAEAHPEFEIYPHKLGFAA
jgi:peptide/nickel transport system substrate-binding protein